MPKPLSEVAPNGKLTFNASVLRTSPFAADVAYIIALWAHTDGNIASILSRMLKTDIAVGTAMYLALINSGGQRSALDAAAKEALPEWQYLILKAINSVAQPLREQRNHFAHRVWGQCSELNDAILLTHPKTIVSYNASHRQRVLSLPDGRGVLKPAPIEDKEISVYTAVDFEEAVKQAERASRLYELFYGVISNPEIPYYRAEILNDVDVKIRVSQMAKEADDLTKAFLSY
jgi:hypothetical protein